MSWLSRMKTGRDASRVWQEKHDALAPKVGDPAPDFELSDVSGEHRDVSDGHRVRLSDFQGDKPVALVFGSFT
jgi:hypothetical protein